MAIKFFPCSCFLSLVNDICLSVKSSKYTASSYDYFNYLFFNIDYGILIVCLLLFYILNK